MTVRKKIQTDLRSAHNRFANKTSLLIQQLVLLFAISLGLYSLSVGTLYAGDDHVHEATSVARTVAKIAPETIPTAHDRIEKETNSQSVPVKVKSPETIFARSTSYNKDEKKSDEDTRADKTSTEVDIFDLKELGLGTVAVDPKVIPYGSAIIAPDNTICIAVDTGGDVKKRKASKERAEAIGLLPSSKEYRAPVLDFYSYKQMGKEWDNFRFIRYEGKTPFQELTSSEKNEYLKTLSKILGLNSLLASSN